jgi:hypothetical protein
MVVTMKNTIFFCDVMIIEQKFIEVLEECAASILWAA